MKTSNCIDVSAAPSLDITTAITGQTTVTTAGTEVQISTASVPLNNGLFIKALSTNTGTMYVGNDGAGAISSSTGYPLKASEQIILAVADLSHVWVDASVNGEKIAWLKG